MELSWSLSEIYKSFKDEGFINDILKLDKCIEDIKTLVQLF